MTCPRYRDPLGGVGRRRAQGGPVKCSCRLVVWNRHKTKRGPCRNERFYQHQFFLKEVLYCDKCNTLFVSLTFVIMFEGQQEPVPLWLLKQL